MLPIGSRTIGKNKKSLSLFDEVQLLIHNADMCDKVKKYEDNFKFLEFLTAEFCKTAGHATVEELAEFAFGSMEEAIEAFESRN